MRQVILQIDITLDGFAAGLHGETDWVTADEAMNHDASVLLSTVDTILLGRVAYQQFAEYWPFADTTASSTQGQIAAQLNTAAKVVFQRHWTQLRGEAGIMQDSLKELLQKKSRR